MQIPGWILTVSISINEENKAALGTHERVDVQWLQHAYSRLEGKSEHLSKIGNDKQDDWIKIKLIF